MLNLAHYEEMERQVMAIFKSVLFDPIVSVIQAKHPTYPTGRILNTNDALAEAMRVGQIQYDDGVFSGQFSAKTSRALRALGATFDQRSKTFKLNPALVPTDVKSNAAAYLMQAEATNRAIQRRLDEVQDNLDHLLDVKQVKSKGLVDRVVSDFHSVAKKIEIPMNLSDAARDRLAAGYTENMKLWIKKWCEEEITELRDRVEANAVEGYRFDNLVAQIQGRFSVSQSKAKFLARQETALFVSKFRKERFSESGVTRYKWSTSHDERVRPAPWVKGRARLDNHRILDGKIFSYDNPPVVDVGTGRRANPGEDYNCRCVDIPILESAHVIT